MEYLPYVLTILFYSCSGVMDAIMDTLSDHFSISIFSKLDPHFWSKSVSFTNKYVNGDIAQGHKKFSFLGIQFDTIDAFSDAWHISKFLREGYIILATISMMFATIQNTVYAIVMIFLLAIFRNLSFNIFYNYILKR